MKLATYNMRNLFDDFTEDGSSPSKPDFEVKALVRSINALNADIIGAQEVESDKALRKINSRLRRPYEHVQLVKGNSHRGIHLGFMSRYPFSTKSHKRTVLTHRNNRTMMEFKSERARAPSPAQFQRDCLLGEFDVGAEEKLAVFNLHLKSQRNYNWMRNKADEFRAAEARAAARIVKAYRGNLLVVLGDFNEKTNEPPIDALTNGLGYYDPLGEEIEKVGGDAVTYHRIVSYRSRIDYVLLSDEVKGSYRDRSVTIHRSNNTRKGSDHYPVSVELNF